MEARTPPTGQNSIHRPRTAARAPGLAEPLAQPNEVPGGAWHGRPEAGRDTQGRQSCVWDEGLKAGPGRALLTGARPPGETSLLPDGQDAKLALSVPGQGNSDRSSPHVPTPDTCPSDGLPICANQAIPMAEAGRVRAPLLQVLVEGRYQLGLSPS